MFIEKHKGPQIEHKEQEPKPRELGTEIICLRCFWQIQKWTVKPMPEGERIMMAFHEIYSLKPPSGVEGIVEEEVVESKSYSSDEEYMKAYHEKAVETSIAGTVMLVKETTSDDSSYEGMSYELKITRDGDFYLIYSYFGGSEIAEGTDSYLVKTNPSAQKVIDLIQGAKKAPDYYCYYGCEYRCEKGSILDLKRIVNQIQNEERRKNAEIFVEALQKEGILEE